MKKILYLILGLIGVLSVKAQPDCFFTHYSSEDGLSQNTVMSILQDRKGNIWLVLGMALISSMVIHLKHIRHVLIIVSC